MSPIDDELRSLLQHRAATLAPAPDPLAGVESRARGLRRRRTVAAVASAAAVVTAVAVAVPLALGHPQGSRPGGYASASPAVAEPAGPYALDPAHPWPFRGDRAALANGVQASFQREWQVRHPGSTLTPLWAQVYEPSGSAEGLLLGRGDGTDRLAFLQSTESGPEVVWELALARPVLSVAVELAGDEVGRLLVVAAPTVGQVDYAPDGTTWTQLAELAPGVAVGPREGTPQARYRVLAPDGSLLDDGPVSARSTAPAGDPGNVLTWVHRGDAPTIPAATVARAYEQASGTSGGSYRSLYDGTRNGLRFTVGQAWGSGESAAHTVAYDSSGTLFLGPQTPPDPWLLAAVFAGPPDLLVLLPRPGAGRVGYSPDAHSAFTDVASGRSDLNPVGLVDRDPRATDDRVQVHRGDDSVILTEAVARLTCGAKECG